MLPETREGDQQRSVFAEARRMVTWHYQWIIVNEFLPQIVGASLVQRHPDARAGASTRRDAGEQSIPVEFQAAAYRFGHSMVRPSYRANLAGDGGAAVLRLHLRPGRGGAGRSGRSARRRARAAAVHRLADVLRFRRRPDRQRAAEQD